VTSPLRERDIVHRSTTAIPDIPDGTFKPVGRCVIPPGRWRGLDARTLLMCNVALALPEHRQSEPMTRGRCSLPASWHRLTRTIARVRRTRPTSRDEQGFTLLEVMIAFIIAGLALGVLFHSGLSSLQSIQTAARYEEALARARSRLAIAVHGAPMTPGDLEGDDGDGYHWHTRIATEASTNVRPYGMRGAGRPTWVSVGLYSISVSVSWSDHGGRSGPRREVRLDTQHVESLAK